MARISSIRIRDCEGRRSGSMPGVGAVATEHPALGGILPRCAVLVDGVDLAIARGEFVAGDREMPLPDEDGSSSAEAEIASLEALFRAS